MVNRIIVRVKMKFILSYLAQNEIIIIKSEVSNIMGSLTPKGHVCRNLGSSIAVFGLMTPTEVDGLGRIGLG